MFTVSLRTVFVHGLETMLRGGVMLKNRQAGQTLLPDFV